MTRTAAYLRLSKEDGDKAESDSIASQRSIIRDFISDRADLILTEEFSDDGFSGVSFDRPAFTKMIEAARNGQIDCIIVKDLSRLGRNYIESGRYLERIFPMLGVRFISILDNYDSALDYDSGQILVSFKNIINDAYCRDISMKIRSSLDNKRRNGEFIGSFAPYGYKKDKNDHNHLVIDNDAAEVIRQIFRMKIDGHNPRRIADILDETGVPAPTEYKKMCGEKFSSGFQKTASPKWSAVTVKRILRNEVYTGNMVQNKMKKINYKLKERRPVEQSEWIRVKNTHEPIIPRDVFDAVQLQLSWDTRTSPKMETIYPFSGIMKCADCGENMVRRNSYRDRNGEMIHSYVCSGYVHGKKCQPHNILERLIEPAVMDAIDEQIRRLNEAENVVKKIIRQPEFDISVRLYERQIADSAAEERRCLDLKERLFADLRCGIISREEFQEMSRRFAEKAQVAQMRRSQLQKARSELLAGSSIPSDWMDDLRAAQNIGHLDRNTVVTLIEKIIIHDKEHIEVVFRHGSEMADYIAFAGDCRSELVG